MAATPSISTLLRDRIAERMTELSLSPTDLKNQTGLTGPGLAPVYRGEIRKYQVRLKRPLCAALGWTTDSIDRLLAGQEPQVIDAVPEPGVIARLEVIEGQLSEVLDVLGQRDEKFGALAAGIEANHALLSKMVPTLKALKAATPKPPTASPVSPSGRKHSSDLRAARSGGVRKRAGR